MKRVLMTVAVSLLSAVSFAQDGALDFNASLRRGNLWMDVKSDGPALNGSLNFNGRPLINLTQKDGSWNGFYGGVYISRTELLSQKEGSVTYRLVTTIGFYDFTFKLGKKGNMEINGFGPRGEMILAGVNFEKREWSVMTRLMNLGAKESKKLDGSFSGSMAITNRGFDSGFVNMKSSGRLNPVNLVNSEKDLYAIVYILPYL